METSCSRPLRYCYPPLENGQRDRDFSTGFQEASLTGNCNFVLNSSAWALNLHISIWKLQIYDSSARRQM